MSGYLLIPLGGGLASAVFYLSVRAGSPMAAGLTYLAPAPLLAVGLSRGLTAGAIAILVGALTLALGVRPLAALLYLAAAGLPSLIIIRQGMLSRPGATQGAFDWYPPGLLLAWLTVYGLAMLVSVNLMFSGVEGGLEGEIRRAMEVILKAYDETQGGRLDPRIREIADGLAPFVPGWLISAWLIVFVINGAVAQGLLTRIGQAARPTPAYTALELPNWLGILLAGAVVLSFLPGGIGGFGRNALPILATPFLLCGLAVIHTLSRRVPGRAAVLAAVYMMLVILSWLSAVIAILGLAEQWVDLRRRFGNSGEKPEGE
ncbi:MAG: DUF2232 domain-containing protein [Alphaproteobacteria bacterium]